MQIQVEKTLLEPAAGSTGGQTRAEQRWVWLFALLVMAATSLPTFLGYAFEGEAWRFTGFVFAVEDGNSYLAKMGRGAAGEWFFRTPYTAMPQRGALLYLPYLLLGKLAAGPGLHEQLAVLYHLFRFAAGVLAILATYDFLAELLPQVRLRRWGLALATLGGGLGWVLALLGRANWLGSYPLEFYSPETFGFLALLGFPHLALGRAMLLWGLVRMLRQARQPDEEAGWRAGLKIGALWLAGGMAQPLTAAIGLGVTGMYLAVLAARQTWHSYKRQPVDKTHWWKLARTTAWAALLPGALLLYYFVTLRQDAYLKSWAAQNLIRSPHPFHYGLAYGLVLPFAWFGACRLLRNRPRTAWLAVAWALALPFLAYAPLDLQRRLVEGGWVALVALSMASFIPRTKPESGWQPGFYWMPMLFTLSLPAALMLLWGGVRTASQPAGPVFRPAEEVRAFEFLKGSAQPDEVVLASYATGNALPAWAAVRVVIGHRPESSGLAGLQPKVEALYKKQTADETRLALIAETGADYIFWGPQERAVGDWDPRQAGYLEEVFVSGEYVLLKVSLD